MVLPYLASLLLGITAAQAAPFTTSGPAILDPQGQPFHLRGFNVEWWTPPTDQDAADIQHLGANAVRYMFGYNPKGAYDPTQIAEVQRQIHYFTARGLWVVPVLYTFEGPNPADPKKKLGPWNSPQLNAEFLALWTDLISRLKDEPHILAWEPMNEPHDADAAWYRELIPRLRRLDPLRPIVIEGANYSHAVDLTDAFLSPDPNIIYAFHMYDPYNYTTDIQKPPLVYPGPWGPAYLHQIIEPARLFRERNHVPVWCGEWGVKTAAPNYPRYLQDLHDVLAQDGFDWNIWAWAYQAKDPNNTTFDINTAKPEVLHVVSAFFTPPAATPPPTP
jgi:aryl-phospho-beta-D-glucosidase BglC (GH1 family)